MSDRVTIGRVGRAHGLDGSFVVERPSDDARWWRAGARLLVGGIETEVVSAKRPGGRVVVKVDPPAERGAPIEVERALLPPTDDGEYYVFELVGLVVEEDGGRALGRVADVLPGIANDVLELDSGLALPLVEDCVRDVDLEAGRILVAPGFSDPD
jgi:16S rRNA processing protein RimM